MIGRITGQLIEKTPPTLCIDVHGIGYEVDVPMSTLYNLPEIGHSVTLYTHLAIREDAHVLFGFGTADERIAFRQLIKVTGIGARTALSILSGMTVSDLTQAIALQETGRLIKVPGIGKKTAERLLLELRGKLGEALPQVHAQTSNNHQSDILGALLALGYSEKDALLALKSLPQDIGVSDGIKAALKMLA